MDSYKLLIIIEKLKSIENRLTVIENALVKQPEPKSPPAKKQVHELDNEDEDEVILFKPTKR